MDWLEEFSINAGTTIITFGAGYGTGALAGAALTSATKLSKSAIMGITTALGGLAGSGAKTGKDLIF